MIVDLISRGVYQYKIKPKKAHLKAFFFKVGFIGFLGSFFLGWFHFMPTLIDMSDKQCYLKGFVWLIIFKCGFSTKLNSVNSHIIDQLNISRLLLWIGYPPLFKRRILEITTMVYLIYFFFDFTPDFFLYLQKRPHWTMTNDHGYVFAARSANP